MELQSKAQHNVEEILMVEDHDPHSHEHHGHEHSPMPTQIVLTPISAPMEFPSIEVAEEGSEPEHMEVGEPGQIELVVEDLEAIPGLFGDLDPAREAELEVTDAPDDKDAKKKEKDDNDAKAKAPKDSWDWEAHGHEGFLEWIKNRFKSVPKHSGYDSSGLERAVSYLEKLDNEISKAMRLDLDGKLDADKIEDVRAKIEDGIDRLYERLEKIKKKTKKKKADFVEDEALVKEAQKAAGVRGIYVMAPLFISCIARTCINGYVSAGHDMEGIFKKLSTKYKLNDREKMETIQLLADMGFPVRLDRGMIDEEVDITSSDNVDWAANYKA